MLCMTLHDAFTGAVGCADVRCERSICVQPDVTGAERLRVTHNAAKPERDKSGDIATRQRGRKHSMLKPLAERDPDRILVPFHTGGNELSRGSTKS